MTTTNHVFGSVRNRVISAQIVSSGVTKTSTATKLGTSSLSGTKCYYLSTAGKGLRRTKFGPQVHHTTRTTASNTTKPVEQPLVTNATSNNNNNTIFESPEVIVVDTTTKIKNAVLAVSLLGFCAGVVVYSMNSVGQAGVSNETGGTDPLAVLKQEAAAAQRQHDKNEAEDKKSAAMIQQFQAGQYDPDKLPDDDDLETPPAKKKAWWKFW